MAQTATAKKPESGAHEVQIPKRPAPTAEQAAKGIVPAATGNGTFGDIMKLVRSQPRLTDEEFEAFQAAIIENRTLRRQVAEERTE